MDFVREEKSKQRTHQRDIDGRTERVYKRSEKVWLEVGLWNVIAACAREQRSMQDEVIYSGMKKALAHKSAVFGGA